MIEDDGKRFPLDRPLTRRSLIAGGISALSLSLLGLPAWQAAVSPTAAFADVYAPAFIPGGRYQIVVAERMRDAGRTGGTWGVDCDDDPSDYKPGDRLQLWDNCYGVEILDTDHWEVENAGGTDVRIRAIDRDLFFDITQPLAGAGVQLYWGSGSAGQLWTCLDVGGGQYEIAMATNHDLVIGIPGYNLARDQELELQAAQPGNIAQTFMFRYGIVFHSRSLGFGIAGTGTQAWGECVYSPSNSDARRCIQHLYANRLAKLAYCGMTEDTYLSHFGGWQLAGYGDRAFAGGEEVINLNSANPSEPQIEAWPIWQLYVDLDANGGDMSVADASITGNRCVIRPHSGDHGALAVSMSRIGHKFLGFFDAPEGGSAIWDERCAAVSGTGFWRWDSGNLQYVHRGDAVAYAHWQKMTYLVHFEGNGATGGATEDQEMTYDVKANLNANGFFRSYSTNYDSHGGDTISPIENEWAFRNWATRADGTGSTFSDRQQVKNLTSSDMHTVTLHAQWDPGLTPLPSPGTPASFTWRGREYPEKRFTGWFDRPAGGTRVGGVGDGICVDKDAHDGYWPDGQTFHARWETTYAQVTYVMDPGTTAEATRQDAEKVPVGVRFEPDEAASSWARRHCSDAGGNGGADIWYVDRAGKVPFAGQSFEATPDGQVMGVTLYGFSLCDVTLASGDADFVSAAERDTFGRSEESGAQGSLEALSGLPVTLSGLRLGTGITFADSRGAETATYSVAGARTESRRVISDMDLWCHSDSTRDAGGVWHPYQVDAEPLRWHASRACADPGVTSIAVRRNATHYKRWLAGGYEGVRSE